MNFVNVNMLVLPSSTKQIKMGGGDSVN